MFKLKKLIIALVVIVGTALINYYIETTITMRSEASNKFKIVDLKINTNNIYCKVVNKS